MMCPCSKCNPMVGCHTALTGLSEGGRGLPKDITLEQLKDRYEDLMKEHQNVREKLWQQEDEIHAYRKLLKGLL